MYPTSQKKNASNLPVSGEVFPLEREQGELLLIQRCQLGNAGAWDALFHNYQKDVFRIALSLSHNREDAEDITGQVFVRLYQSLHTFRNKSRFRPWLFCIVYRTFLDMCIRPAYRTHPAIEYLRSTDDEFASKTNICDPTPTPEGICLEKEAAQILQQAIGHLPPVQGQMLVRFHTDGKSYQEIATETGLPIGTVKSRLNRARKMLRERLTPYQECFAA